MFDRESDAPEHWFHYVGEAEESEVGVVESVDGCFVVITAEVVGSEIVKIGVFGSEFFVFAFPVSVEGCHFVVGSFVEADMGELRVFDKEDGNGGMGLADDVVEWNEKGVHLSVVNIGNAVHYNQSWVGDSSDEVGDDEVELAVAAKAEVDDFAVKATGQDVGVSHAGTVSTSTLKQACAIHYDWFLANR